MNRLLLIEDEEVILKALKRLLERNHYDVTIATTVESAIDQQPQAFDLILADLRLPGAPGTDIIAIADPVPVVIMTSHASVRSAVEAMRNGAIDYIAKPFDHNELLLVIERSLLQNRMRSQNQALKQDLQRLAPSEILSVSSAMQAQLESLSQLRDQQRCIHLCGEVGSGLELLARTLHANSDRHDAPLMIADIPSLEQSAARTLLLGSDNLDNASGSQTNGLLQAAHNGTLIVRHPQAMPKEAQLALADALRAGGIAGSAGQRAINVRTIIISDSAIADHLASTRLEPAFAELFAHDEFFIAPLRNRREDIAPLANFYLQHHGKRHNRVNIEFSDNALAALLAYDWPGNVMELGNVIEHAVLVGERSSITTADLGLGVLDEHASAVERDLNLDEYFRFFVLRYQNILSETELASRLGISRKSLWERRQKMHLVRSGSAGG